MNCRVRPSRRTIGDQWGWCVWKDAPDCHSWGFGAAQRLLTALSTSMRNFATAAFFVLRFSSVTVPRASLELKAPD